MAEACADVGLDSMPAGMAALTRRQRTFVLAYLRTGNASEAARVAGYSDPHADGYKVRTTPVVAAVLTQAAVEVSKNADQLVKRAWQRSVSLHALYEAEMDKAPGLRNTAQLLKLAAELNRVDGLLGTLLGKITGVNVSGTVHHKHSGSVQHIPVTVPESALPVLAQMRRDVTTPAIAAPSRN